MEKPILIMNLQTHDDSDIDWNKFQEEFEKEFKEEPPAAPANTEPETKEDNPPATEPEKKDGDPAPAPNTEPEKKGDGEPKPPVQTPEANRAFQELRRQAEAGQPFVGFVSELAAKAGMTPEQYMQAVKDAELEKEAKALGKDPELYKRMTALEQKSKADDEEKDRLNFNTQVELARVKLNLKPEDVQDTFVKAAQMGINPRVVPFEALHKLVNPVDPAEVAKKAVQDYLEEQKKKADNYVPNGGGTPAPSNPDDDLNKQVMDFLRESGDIT